MTWTWMMWMLLLSPVIFVLMGTGFIGAGVWLKRGGSAWARFVFAAGAGAYVGGITCLLAWAVDEDAGRMMFVGAFFALTLAWVIGCLLAAARAHSADTRALSAPGKIPTLVQ